MKCSKQKVSNINSGVQESNIPIVAIVGRPNVGKSSLFNRICGKRKAIVEEASGTTRDRIHLQVVLEGRLLEIIDTAGIDFDTGSNIKDMANKQTKDAMLSADLIVFVVDSSSGVTALDLEVVRAVRKSGKKVILVANKADYDAVNSVSDFLKMGFGDPIYCSAIHNIGVGLLVQKMLENIKPVFLDKTESEITRVMMSIVGRPNVGKSSFVNIISKQNRVIVDDTPGTTRDSIDIFFQDGEFAYQIVDTAGLKHKRKIKEVVEVFSQARTKESIRRSDVVVHMIDAVEGFSKDDLNLLSYTMSNLKPVLIVVNKWDLVEGMSQKEYSDSLYEALGFCNWIPIIFISCKMQKNLKAVVDTVRDIYRRSRVIYSTHQLNKAIHTVEKSKSKFFFKNKQIRAFYITQKGVNPMSFIIFTSTDVVAAYLKYVENILRKVFDLTGIPFSIDARLRSRD